MEIKMTYQQTSWSHGYVKVNMFLDISLPHEPDGFTFSTRSNVMKWDAWEKLKRYLHSQSDELSIQIFETQDYLQWLKEHHDNSPDRTRD